MGSQNPNLGLKKHISMIAVTVFNNDNKYNISPIVNASEYNVKTTVLSAWLMIADDHNLQLFWEFVLKWVPRHSEPVWCVRMV